MPFQDARCGAYGRRSQFIVANGEVLRCQSLKLSHPILKAALFKKNEEERSNFASWMEGLVPLKENNLQI
jgi:hypothetical protein